MAIFDRAVELQGPHRSTLALAEHNGRTLAAEVVEVGASTGEVLDSTDSTDSTNWAQLGPWVTGSPSNFSSGTGALHPGATGSSDPAHGSCSASEKTQKSHGFLDRLVAWYKG